jgi:hypothetical protein
VGVGIYATALWLIGRVAALPEMAAPGNDRGALENDVRAALKRRAVRSSASAEARLGRGGKSSTSAEAGLGGADKSSASAEARLGRGDK